MNYLTFICDNDGIELTGIAMDLGLSEDDYTYDYDDDTRLCTIIW